MHTLNINASKSVQRVDQVKEARLSNPWNRSHNTVDWSEIIGNIMLMFDHDLTGGGKSKAQLSVLCQVVLDTLIAFKSRGQQDEVDECGSHDSME